MRTNLQNAFPEKSEMERAEIEKKFYRFLTDLILETIKMLSISTESIKKRFKLINAEIMQEHFNAGRSVLLVSGHYGNWEWSTIGLPLGFKEPLLVIYKPLSDKNFQKMFNSMRSKTGGVLVSMKQTLKKIIEFKGQIYFAGFASDQTPPQGESKHFTNFLNQPTSVFLGVEKIAKLTNNTIIFGHFDRVKRGYYTCTFKTLFTKPKDTKEFEITERHTRELEQIIQKKPELWLWSHKRWKFKPEDVQ